MKRYFSLLAISFLFLGTTFIVKEGGVEVGRWEEQDGKDETEIIENDKPVEKPVNEPIQMPEGPVAEWRVSGKLVDVITLKRLSGAEIIFKPYRVGLESVTVKVYPEGGFSARLPQLKDGYYMISVNPPPGYDHPVHLLKDHSFSKIPYKERLSMRGSVPFGAIGHDRIFSNTYDMEVGLFTLQASEQERKDYQKIVLGMPEL